MFLYLRLHDVVNGQVERDASQWAHPARVAVDQGLRIKLGSIRIGRAEDGNEVLFAVLFDEFLDAFLTLRVKCTGGRSDKAFRLHQHRLGAGAANTGFDSRPLHAISFPDDDHFFTFKVQLFPSSKIRKF